MNFKRLLTLGIGLFFLIGFFWVDNWERTMDNGDSSGYYMHTVSIFHNQDVGDYEQTIGDYLKNNPKALDPREDIYGVRKLDTGKRYIKYTLGVGLMEAPFYAIGHVVAKLSDTYEADAWSKPYVLAVHLSKVFYIVLGFYFLIGILQTYFKNWTIVLTTLAIAFATNLFYHGTFLTLAHAFLFFAFCLLIHLSQKFYEAPNLKRAFAIGAVIGLIALMRVPEIIGLLVPLMWGVYNKTSFLERFYFYKNNYKYLIAAACSVVIVFLPQIAYWHYVSGHYFFNPYQGETFNFFKPHILEGWTNFRNGWLVYTPIMVFALIGIILMRKTVPQVILPLLSFLFLNAWIHYSYYVWNYYPGMGSRPMIECYPLLAFALAALFKKVQVKPFFKGLAIILVGFFIWLNLFQSWQMREGLIWTQRGSQGFYIEMFGKTSSTLNALRAYDTKKVQPNEAKLGVVDTLYFNDFEDSIAAIHTSAVANSGTYAILDTNVFSCDTTLRFNDIAIQKGDWLKVGVHAYRKGDDMVWNRDGLENLVVELYDDYGKKKRSSLIKIASHIGNDNSNIWHCGQVDTWDEASFYLKMPHKVNSNWSIKLYILNYDKHKLYLDDLYVEQWRH